MPFWKKKKGMGLLQRQMEKATQTVKNGTLNGNGDDNPLPRLARKETCFGRIVECPECQGQVHVLIPKTYKGMVDAKCKNCGHKFLYEHTDN